MAIFEPPLGPWGGEPDDHERAIVPPKPIPGGNTLPDGTQMHVCPAIPR